MCLGCPCGRIAGGAEFGFLRDRFPANVEVFGHTLSTRTELAIVVVSACVFMALAVRGFSRAE